MWNSKRIKRNTYIKIVKFNNKRLNKWATSYFS